MFDDLDDKYKDMFSDFNNNHSYQTRGMDYKVILYICSGIFVVLLLLGCCCKRRRNRGQVLSPAPVTVVTTPAPYPQQQYVAAGPVGYPHPQNVYPSYSPAPAPGPVLPPNPPYPSNYPYPAPYVQQPQPYSSAPSAPDANALPPSYDQVCAKQPPYNQSAY